MFSESSRFYPNRFTFGGVTAERVNTAKLPHKVNSIFGRSRASSQIITRISDTFRTDVNTTIAGMVHVKKVARCLSLSLELTRLQALQSSHNKAARRQERRIIAELKLCSHRMRRRAAYVVLFSPQRAAIRHSIPQHVRTTEQPMGHRPPSTCSNLHTT